MKESSISGVLFKFCYVLFIVAELFYGDFNTESILSPRLIMLALMTFLCLIERAYQLDKYWKLYIPFLALFVLSSILTGYADSGIKFLIGRFFCAWVMYCSTIHIIRKYDGIQIVIRTLLAICIIDALVTIAQYFTLPFSYEILEILNLNAKEGLEDSLLFNSSVAGNMEGHALPGLFPSAVKNGYLLAIGVILSFYNRNNRITVINITIWLITLVALYVCQERSALGFGLLFSIAYFYLYFRNLRGAQSYIIIMFVLVAVFAAYKIFGIISSGDSKYVNKGFDMSDRWEIYANAIDFFMEYPFGCYFKYMDFFEKDPHNIFLSALLYGGLLGFVFIIIILTMQFVSGIEYLRKQKNAISVGHVCLFAYAVYIANALFHNHSIVNGSCTAWLLWASFVAISTRLYRLQEKNRLNR